MENWKDRNKGGKGKSYVKNASSLPSQDEESTRRMLILWKKDVCVYVMWVIT